MAEKRKPSIKEASVELSLPINAYSESLSVLHLKRRVNLGDMVAADDMGNAARLMVIVSRLADIPESAAKEIDGGDIPAVKNAVDELTDPFLRTGPN